jgi:LysR family transcriptional regulator of gallate degradation
MIPTKHLRPFLAVAQSGSLARASDSLRRAQSAVSRSVRELEESLGAPLLERGGRRLLLTDCGRTLSRRTERAFAELERARQGLLAQFPEAAAHLRTAPIFALGVGERRLDVLLQFQTRQHISRVASTIGVSQPAVSMALQDLESGTGVPLFDRAHAGVGPTAAGQLLMEHLRRALAELRLAQAEVAALQGVVEGQLVVGALPFARAYMLPAAIGRLRRQHAMLQVRTVEAPIAHLLAELRMGDIDFLVGALPGDALADDLVREELGLESLSLIVRADHPLALSTPTWTEVAQHAWVLPGQGNATRRVFESSLALLGRAPPKVAVESSDLSVIRGLLLEADMVTAASHQLFHHELQAGALHRLPLELPGTARAIGILRRTDAHSGPGARLLIQALREVGVGGAHAASLSPA